MLTVTLAAFIYAQLCRDRNKVSAVSNFGLILNNMVGSKHTVAPKGKRGVFSIHCMFTLHVFFKHPPA